MPGDTPAIPTSTPTVETLVGLLRRGDFVGAGQLLDGATPQPGDDVIRNTAEGLMRRRRWMEAAWLFGRVMSRDPACEMKRRLAGNLAAMQVHRPALYDRLIALPATDAFGIAPAANG